MARDFRSSRYRGNAGVGEDVNPSAYIVNLADCMLVLACGFLVALISFYNIDVMPATELTEDELEQVEPEEMPEELLAGGGSYFVEAGKVYRDPSTGVLYMVEQTNSSESGEAAAEGEAASGTSAEGVTATEGAATSGGSASTASVSEIQSTRANGAD